MNHDDECGIEVRRTGPPLAAGRRLEVDAVLEGSIHRQDGRVRVTARLVAVNSEGHLGRAVRRAGDRSVYHR